MSVFPAPAALGRGAMVAAGSSAPEATAGWPRFVVDSAVMADPEATVTGMHELWAARQPYLVDLRVDQTALKAAAAEIETAEPYTLDPSFTFWRERLHFLAWANTWDMRGDEPVWWWARKAERLGAKVTPEGPADVRLPDGTPAFVDGGPAEPFAPGAFGAVVVHRTSIEAGGLTPGEDRSPSARLAPDQLEAVAHRRGPARIIAPAGSGKTRVLTERLRHLLVDRHVDPRTLTAVAYNKRAADEMAERTADLGANIRTLNSLGLAITNGTGGFRRPANATRRQVIEERGVRSLLDGLIELRRAPNTDPYVPYLDGLRAIRLGLEPPRVVEAAFDAAGLAEIFPRYVGILADKGLIDFDGQLYEAVRVLLTEPQCRDTAQLLARHLLVDEFQDLTPVHVLLLRLMASPAYDVFGVGDDDQVIYGFGGASPRFLIDFAQYFPAADAHALEVNYRCPPTVISATSMLLSYNRDRIDKAVRPAPGREPADGELVVRRLNKLDEAPACRDLVQAWRDDDVPYERMAVLGRVNAGLLPLQVMFQQSGVPCRRPLDRSILERTGIRTAFAYLRIGLDPGRISKADVAETIRRPSRKIARNVVEMLTKRAHTSVSDIRRLALRLSGNDTSKLLAYADDLDLVSASVAKGDAAKVFRTIRVRIGLGEAMDVLDSARREADRSTHGDDLAALEQVAALHPDPATFVDWLTDALDDRGPGAPGVELSTIHRVKGREWDRVIVFGVDGGVLPHRLAEDISEERRLLHVAVTRARDKAYVFANQDEPSPFLDEMNGVRPRLADPPPSRRAMAVPVRNSPTKVELDAASTPVSDALREWRRQAAAAAKVPAFTVLHDVHLDGIAVRRPKDLMELAACPGIGPAKLERWGDEILAVVEAVAGP